MNSLKIKFKKSNLAWLIAVFGLIFSIIGCSSTSHARRGTLSEATKKSSKSYSGERKVKSSTVKSSSHDRRIKRGSHSHVEIHIEDDDEPEWDYHERTPHHHSGSVFSETGFGIRAFSSYLQPSQLMQEIGGSFLLNGYVGQKTRLSMGAGFGVFGYNPYNNIHESMYNLGQVHWLFQYRRYFSKVNKSPMNAYFKFEIAPQLRFWSYYNPIYTDVYDEYGYYLGEEEIISDGLGSCAFETGLGYTLLRVNNLEIDVDLNLGMNLMSWETSQGFINDMFYNEMYMRVGFEFNL